MAETDRIDLLIDQIKELIKKLDKPKADMRGWLTVITSFFASVVIAGLSLFYSHKESIRGSDERQRGFAYNQLRDSLQAEIQKANLRVEELQALKDLIPSLASKDPGTRAIAIQLLQASSKDDKGAVSSNKNNGRGNSHKGDTIVFTEISANKSIIDKFYSLLAIAGSSSEPDDKRQRALKEAQPILASNKISESDKRKGLTIVSGIAAAPSTPGPVKQVAESVVANIKLITLAELPRVLAAEKVTRPINSIIFHHTGTPFTIANFQGASTIFNIAKFQTTQMNWSRISWHYAIQPDGSIWLGMPLNEMAIHAKEQNKTSVSILLIMDGDKELPTESQKAATSGVLKLLFPKLHLTAENFHSHRFYDKMKTCPGQLVTEEYIAQLVQ